ncbi:MAG: hypothetical protein GY820_07700 [Gammaproteobacteria bacterium]|nr:hypothetical protein [Gammaproteobacteria bacterium]
MPIELEIHDGSPNWWNSLDIWIVPGSDPDGPPGQPIAGQPAYLWGRARNNGSNPANGARVNFYWSNPATGVLRSNSTPVGSSFVDLDPGETQEVLCLTPWIPTIVNDGHECVVAEIIHPGDPLPSPLPDAFNPPDHLQIAQRNLSVLSMKKSMIVLPIQLSAPAREKRSLEVMVETGGEIDQKALVQLGAGKLKQAKNSMVDGRLSLNRAYASNDVKHCEHHLKVELSPGTSKAVYLRLVPRDIKKGLYTPVHVTECENNRIVGGITFLVTQSMED